MLALFWFLMVAAIVAALYSGNLAAVLFIAAGVVAGLFKH